MIDEVLTFCSDLIKCRSVTPEDNGAIDYIADYLSSNGFITKILTFKSSDENNCIKNLYARYGTSNKKILGFLGHSDVVPAGDMWIVEPFGGILRDGYLYGRGVCDMKGGISAFCTAVTDFIKQKTFDGSIIVLITGDEEIGSQEGAQSLINWCEKYNQLPHDCLIGEPSSHEKIGDRVYIGHRGSINIEVKSVGKQGHVAYQGSYKNSLSDICMYISQMLNHNWKYNDKRYPETNLEPTLLYTNNYATNVAPDLSTATLNIRYGADYTAEDLETICKTEAEKYGISLKFSRSGDAYCCDDKKLQSILSSAIYENTELIPQFSCAGGTSDGRFMKNYCNIIEFGLQDANIHQKNERAKIDDLILLTKIYGTFLHKYFEY